MTRTPADMKHSAGSMLLGVATSPALTAALAEIVAGDRYTLADWRRTHPSPTMRGPSLADVARRANDGEDFFVGIREFLDAIRLHAAEDLIAERPADVANPVHQAYLGALAEHVATSRRMPVPAWVTEPDRFLDHLWFGADHAGFEALCLVQSPAAFRRRGIFISRGRLMRV